MTHFLPHIEIESGPNPTAAVIWLHGLGADGNDFAAVVPQLQLNGCPAIRFVFPHAPSIAVSVNGGYVMPAWYDIFGANLLSQQDAVGIQRSEKAITALIDRELDRGIAHQNIVLAGFSQGCAMALHTGLRYKQKLAGIVALSGYLPLADTLAHERSQANANTPLFMAHGTQDPVVVLDRGEVSKNALSAMGYSVQWKTYAMGHSVHPQELADISKFLRDVLAA
ncbi:MAG: carboxylesterase [Betaproteobacteria bacterium]|jgi:phospholipase/carboxylesterase|nr:dienelactone hydrolase family protein [Burkholderiales bacterium]NBX90771.1 carboxylesterase [Betaproteobacteria bacterium]